ncbi:hypothetical protein ACSYAD_35635, partial [Acaryochloris marina NIES-2412]|uniref:hypothetical protein n=1 Tax=Acaryochloris marina TaxID=155978 RepID=UPI0040595597
SGDIFPDDRPKAFLRLGLLEVDELERAAIPDFNLGNVDFHGIASGNHEKGPLVGDTRGLSKNDRNKREGLGEGGVLLIGL